MNLMKLFSHNLFLIANMLILALRSTGIFAMNDGPSDNTRLKLSLARDQEALSTEITSIVATYFTIKKLEQAKKDYHLSDETVSFITKAQTDIQSFLASSDIFFQNRPGYPEHKNHLLADIKRFSSCLGYGKDTVEAIKTSLKNNRLEVTSARESDLRFLESPELPAHFGPDSCKKKKAFATKSLKSKIELIHTVSTATSPQTKKIIGRSLKPKADYLMALRELREKSPLDCKDFEYPKEGLTLAIAYKEKLDWLKKTRKPKNAAEMARKKNEYRTMFYELTLIDKEEAKQYEESELGAFLDHEQSASTIPLYDAYALTLRGSLFEFEGTLKTYEFGEEILSLGTNASLSFNTLNKKDVIEEIEKHPNYLHLTGDKTSAVRKLGQEYDAVTKLRIIEFKCINGTIKKYLPNLLRELFVAQKAQDASSSKIVAGSTALSCETIAKKPITCYVKYTTQENEIERSEAERIVIKHGFSVWNGTTYSFSITDEFMIADEYFKHIKNVINKVGPENCCIYIQDTLDLSKNAALPELVSKNVPIIPFTKLEYNDTKKRTDFPAGTEETSPKKQELTPHTTPTHAMAKLSVNSPLQSSKSPAPNHAIRR